MITKPFENTKIILFKTPDEQKLMKDDHKKVANLEFGKEYPIIIDGKEIFNSDKIKSTNPSKPSEVVGLVSKATKNQAIEAIEKLIKIFLGGQKRVKQKDQRYY